MIQKIITYFKKKVKTEDNKDKKEEKKEEDYIPSQFEIWKFYKRFLKIDYKQMAIKQTSMILSTIIYTRQPFILLRIKNGIMNNNYEDLKSSIFEYILTTMIKQIISFIETIYTHDSYRKMREQITKSILEHLFSLDVQYFEDNKVTQVSQVIKQGAQQICNELNYSKIFDFIDSYIYYLGQMYFIYSFSPKILLSMLLLSFISAILTSYLNGKSSKIQKEAQEESEFKEFALDDIINNMTVIKTFGTEMKEITKLDKTIEKNIQLNQKSQFYNKIADMIFNTTYDTLKIVIILQIFFEYAFTDSAGQMASALTEMIGHTYCTIRLSRDIVNIFQAKPNDYYEERKKYIGKVMKLFEVSPAIVQDYTNNQGDKSQFLGDISFENVRFKYPVSKDYLAQMNQRKQEEEKQKLEKEKVGQSQEQDKNSQQKDINLSKNTIHSDSFDSSESSDGENNPQESEILKLGKAKSSKVERENILDDISFQIKKGQFVAFVGTSGSGKSTIVKLIQRYYDVNSGSILLDNKNVKDISLNKLRRSIGLVSQEPSLFDNDIEYNITYGCEDDKYTQEELKYICEISGVSEFVFDKKRFPEGLKTLVGSKGAKLSGGQKQRIAIARALIKKPKILILDEATSALDAESEHIVQQYIDQLVGYRGMTIIVVAHRLSTIIKSDKIFVMKHGQIKEEGTHSELLAKNGIYSKLVHHQINIQQKSLII